jgi:hypothetical protein
LDVGCDEIVEGRTLIKEDMKMWREEVHSCSKQQQNTCDGVLALHSWAFPRYDLYARWSVEQQEKLHATMSSDGKERQRKHTNNQNQMRSEGKYIS